MEGGKGDGIKNKKCNECFESKPHTEFYKQEKYSKSKGNYIYYNPKCKQCVIDNSLKRQKENHEKVYKYNKRLREENPEYFKFHRRKHYVNNREKEAERLKQWQKDNPDKVKVYYLNREQHKKHEITTIEWNNCNVYFNNSCAYCGISNEEAKRMYGNYLHKDHADHEGANDLSNCIPACKSCNGKKHNFNLVEWYTSSEDFTEDRMNRIIKWLKGDYKQFIKTV